MRKKRSSAKLTKHVGVYLVAGVNSQGDPLERLYIMYYAPDGSRHYDALGVKGYIYNGEKLTPAVANRIRADRIAGREIPNKERRQRERAVKAAHDARWTIGKLATEYFTHRERQKTVKTDQHIYKRYLEGEFEDRTPEEVDPLSLDRFRKTLSKRMTTKGEEKKPLSPTSVRNAMALLRQIANHGMERHLTKGFQGKVPVPRVASGGKTEDLSPSQLSALLTALDAEKDQDAADVVRLALYTGARREEILRLRWVDVDLGRSLWMLRDRKAGGDTGFPLSSSATSVLEKREKARHEGIEYVFPGGGKKGYLRDPRAAFKRIKTNAGLPAGFRLMHGLRHYYATSLVAAGVDMLTVSRLLGHRDAQMVMRTYSHVRPGVLAQAAELSGQLIAETTANVRKEKEEADGAANL